MSEAGRATEDLLELMARLRDPVNGCPWDREQTFSTIAPYTLEEAYEVADAIDRGDPQLLRDELGDLLFQVVFHSQMAQERGWFDFAGIARSIHDKLVRRHPHVFGGASIANSTQQSHAWEEHKARERAEGKGRDGHDTSALANVPKALPALTRAAKLGRRAARVGFDWPNAAEVREKVLEELREVDAVLAEPVTARTAPGDGAGSREARLAEEIGDLLFAIANWTLHLKVDPEEALRAANAKFERRFRKMESLALARGLKPETISPPEWDALWREAKAG